MRLADMREASNETILVSIRIDGAPPMRLGLRAVDLGRELVSIRIDGAPPMRLVVQAG